MTTEYKGYLMIALAGSLWGTLGLFGNLLFSYNLPPELVVFFRLFIGFWILFFIILIKNKRLLKIDKKGLKYTALIGLFSQTLFNIFYFQAIKITTIATAVILLYTAPIFLIIMGRIFYKEPLTKIKIFSLILCVFGCFLTITGGSLDVLRLNLAGILIGVGAGFNYALVTILSKALIDDYDSLTIIFYSFGFGWLFLLPFSHPSTILDINYTMPLSIILISLGFFPTVLSYILYIGGLSYNIEASKAGIICSLEIVVSILIAFLFFDEYIAGVKFLGIILVLISIILVNRHKSKEKITIEKS